jgi:hypothetical protein
MEISLLCGVKVMLGLVDKNEKIVLYSSEDLGKFLEKYVNPAIESKNYLKNENVKYL